MCVCVCVQVKVKLLSRVQFFGTPGTVAYQAPPSMGFSRQEYWSELPFPSPGDLPDPGIEPGSPAFQADALTSEPPGKPVCVCVCVLIGFSHVQLFLTLWGIVCQAPLSMVFSRQEYWSGLPWPPPGDLPDSGTEPAFFSSPALSGRLLPLVPPGKLSQPAGCRKCFPRVH